MSYALLALTLVVDVCCVGLVAYLAASCLRRVLGKSPASVSSEPLADAGARGGFALRASDRWTALDDLQVARLFRDPKA